MEEALACLGVGVLGLVVALNMITNFINNGSQASARFLASPKPWDLGMSAPYPCCSRGTETGEEEQSWAVGPILLFVPLLTVLIL